MDYPWRRRFQIEFWRDRPGWHWRLVLARVLIIVEWNAKSWNDMEERRTGISVGWIGLNYKQGELIRCKQWVHRKRQVQEMYTRNGEKY